MRISGVCFISFVLVLVCCFASLPAASASQAAGSQMAQMSIDLTLKKDLRGQSQGLVISYTLRSEELSSGPLALRFDTLEPALERTSDQVTQLHADDAHGEIHFATHGREQQDDRTFQVWRSSRTVDGPLHVSYIVPMASPHPPKRGPHIDLQAAGGGLSGRARRCALASEMARTSTSRARMAYDHWGASRLNLRLWELFGVNDHQ